MRAFLFYIDDWLSSKRIMVMDAAEERGYLRLLLAEATEPDCGLPDDDTFLSITSMLGRQWYKPTKDQAKRIGEKTSGQKIRECFDAREGRLYNTRLLREWDHQNEVRQARAEAGRRGGRPLGEQKQLESNCQSKPQSKSKANQNQTKTNDVCVCVSDSLFGVTQENRESWFSEFWAAYWLRKGRKKAHEAFMRAVTSESIFADVMAGLRTQLPEMQSREARYRPHAATWLNGERWSDEAAPAKAEPEPVYRKEM